MTDSWFRFFLDLYQRTGSGSGNNSTSFNYPTSNGVAGQLLTSQGTGVASIWTDQLTKVSQLVNDLAFIKESALTVYAKLQDPAFTGAPTAPTAPIGTNTGQLATTAFVLANASSLVSPHFTGIPTAPTAAQSTNTTQIATTQYVLNQEANTTPLSGATATAGTSKLISRADHIHPLFGIPNGTAANPGFVGFSTGVVIQFGSSVVTTDSSGNATVNYGIAFPTGCFTFVCSNGDNNASTGGVNAASGIFGISSTVVHCPGSISIPYRVNWFAAGH